MLTGFWAVVRSLQLRASPGRFGRHGSYAGWQSLSDVVVSVDGGGGGDGWVAWHCGERRLRRRFDVDVWGALVEAGFQCGEFRGRPRQGRSDTSPRTVRAAQKQRPAAVSCAPSQVPLCTPDHSAVSLLPLERFTQSRDATRFNASLPNRSRVATSQLCPPDSWASFAATM